MEYTHLKNGKPLACAIFKREPASAAGRVTAAFHALPPRFINSLEGRIADE